MPSTTPRHGSPVAVALMTPQQMRTYLNNDTSLGGGLQTPDSINGLAAMLADGRADATDAEDARYIRGVLDEIAPKPIVTPLK
jgi:hypothetical protein